jgi:hypothetical protein
MHSRDPFCNFLGNISIREEILSLYIEKFTFEEITQKQNVEEINKNNEAREVPSFQKEQGEYNGEEC